MSKIVFSKTKRTDTALLTAPTALVEVSVHTAFEQHLTGLVSDDDSSTVMNTSEKMLEIMGDPSKPNLTLREILVPSTNRLSISCSAGTA
jgi:hypothetical protein